MIKRKEIIDFVKDIIVILIIVFVIRTFFILPFQINGQSMYQSYYDGEFIIVDRFSYQFLHTPNR
jgi:signal peptidase I